jgi:hypothetical protein
MRIMLMMFLSNDLLTRLLTGSGLYEPNPPKTPYTLKRPKTRVVPKTDLYPRKRHIPKNAYP